ncbi:MAG: EscU/YscU/HrcU family type III secretion system export apparatus switch protein [Armatimonadota bacterium]
MFGEFRPYPPTARRREELRLAGDVPASPVLTAAVVLTAAMLSVGLVATRLMGLVGELMGRALTEGVVGWDATGLGDWLAATWSCGRLTLLPGVVALIAACLAGAVQAGLTWRSPLAGRLPLARAARPRRPSGTAGALGGTLAVVACMCVAAGYLASGWRELLLDPTGGVRGLVREVEPLVTGFLATLCAVLLAVGIADLLYRRWAHERRAWMTRGEYVEAMRDQEGHPLTLLRRERQRRRRLR